MKLQPLQSNHLSEIADHLVAYWASRGMKKYSKKWALDYLKQGHRKEIANDAFFTIQKKKEIMGCIALVEYVGKVAEIRDFVLKKKHQRKGIGTKALQSLEKYAKKKKIRKLYALVFPRNQKFFQKNGYEKEGMLKHHFKKGEHLVVMSKFLK